MKRRPSARSVESNARPAPVRQFPQCIDSIDLGSVDDRVGTEFLGSLQPFARRIKSSLALTSLHRK